MIFCFLIFKKAQLLVELTTGPYSLLTNYLLANAFALLTTATKSSL